MLFAHRKELTLRSRWGLWASQLQKLPLKIMVRLFLSLRTLGFLIIGATFIRHIDEIQQLRPAEFYIAAPDGSWRVDDVKEKWREIAFAAQEAGGLMS